MLKKQSNISINAKLEIRFLKSNLTKVDSTINQGREKSIRREKETGNMKIKPIIKNMKETRKENNMKREIIIIINMTIREEVISEIRMKDLIQITIGVIIEMTIGINKSLMISNRIKFKIKINSRRFL